MLPQGCHPATRGWAELALEYWPVTRVDEAVGFQPAALCKLLEADVTLIGLIPGVDAQMPLQQYLVCSRVGAVRALIGPLPRVAPHVPRQLCRFHTTVITLSAPEINISVINTG